jgi:uncharacterized tellurite resistance protein B-like protein
MTEKNKEFQKLLFRTAFCVMACDGEIHQDEIDELTKMDKSTQYFLDVDFTEELKELIISLQQKGKHLISEIANEIKNQRLNTVQELLLLEIVLRMIYADGKVDENEKKLFHLLRSKLNLYDETIKERFGAIEFIFDKSYAVDIVNTKNVATSFEMPDIKEIISIDFSNIK